MRKSLTACEACAGAAADAEDEQPPAALAHGGEALGHRLQASRGKRLGDLGDLGQVAITVGHGFSVSHAR